MIKSAVEKIYQRPIVYIYYSNATVNKEYMEFFPYTELEKTFDIVPIFSKTIFSNDTKYVHLKLHWLTRKIHAIIHYCLIWHRRYSSLAFKLRAYQYFGSENEIRNSSNFGLYNGRRHKLATLLFVRILGNQFGILLLTKILELCFGFESIRKSNRFCMLNSLMVLPYHGGIHLEFDYLVWYSNKLNVRSIAVQQNWDNVSSKSFLLKHPTNFLTWGKQSSSHLRTIQDYRGEIKEIGSLRLYELYLEKFSSESLHPKDFVSENKPKKLKILVIGTGPATYDNQIIDLILKTLKEFSINDFEITYRPHPYQVSNSGLMQPTKNLKFVKLEIPKKEEMNSFRVKLIQQSDIIVSLYSTVLLEATILNKHCIIPAFVTGPKGYNTANFVDDFSHYSGLSSLGTIHTANSTNELMGLISKLKKEENRVQTQISSLNWFCKDVNTRQEIIHTIQKYL